MAKNLFSIPIFFIVFRETLEASIIISVLLGLVEQIVHDDTGRFKRLQASQNENTTSAGEEDASTTAERNRLLIRKLRIQVFAGAALGLFGALAIGAAFIAVWFTQASNLWAKSEEIWEGVFELIAALMIFVMGVTMLKMDRAKAKWRVKLQRAFDGQHLDGSQKTGRWALFLLPLITVLREGMEAVVFVGGVALGQSASSIPIPAIVGLICGLIIGYIIYTFASRSALSIFLSITTIILLLLGAGLFSRSVGAFERQAFNTLLGSDVDDAGGTGPGSYPVQGNIWHLNCCDPEDNIGGQGWSVFNALLGWSNNGSLGTVLSYVFYWIAVIVALVYMKWSEGRVKVFGRESAAGIRRRNHREGNPTASNGSGSGSHIESGEKNEQ